jgi:hypothetical protein
LFGEAVFKLIFLRLVENPPCTAAKFLTKRNSIIKRLFPKKHSQKFIPKTLLKMQPKKALLQVQLKKALPKVHPKNITKNAT